MGNSDLTEFRARMRQFMEINVSDEMRLHASESTFSSRKDIQDWTRILHKKGWSVPGWPKEYGGTGWTPIEEEIFYIEQAIADAPEMSPFGTFMIGPVLIEFGSSWQKQRYLPAIRDGSELWCQGFSEPNSGSDLASLQTRADLEGGKYLINGQKIWTSTGHFADLMFCLVRTSREGAKQRGISMVLIDMHARGVSVKPIVTIDGAHYLNQVFFDNVEVAPENLVGDEGQGWSYAKFLLERERVSSAFLPRLKRDMVKLRALHNELYSNRTADLRGIITGQKISSLECQLMSHEMTVYRILTGNSTFDGLTAAAMIKIVGANLHKEISQLIVELLGPEALPTLNTLLIDAALRRSYSFVGAGEEYCIGRAFSIFGGTNEIQHNIIAKNGLKL